jgi:hypothetical protein
VFFAEPFRLVDDFGKNQSRLDGIEGFSLIKHVVVAAGAAAVDIADILSGTPLRHDPGRQFVAPARHRHDVDAGKLPFEVLQQTLVSIDINVDLPFLLGGGDGSFPICPPIQLSGENFCRQCQDEDRDETV